MKTFYIFKLTREYYSLAKKNPSNIYIIFKTIYRQNKKELKPAFNLFKELCIPINESFFNSFLFEKLSSLESYTKYRNIHMYHDFFSGEESKAIINKSHIKIKSNKYNNVFIDSLLEVENLFICNFKTNSYFLSNKKYIIKSY